MKRQNLQTKMIKDEYKQHIEDETKSFAFEICVSKILVGLWCLMMTGACGFLIYNIFFN